jgi:hypothetical protein
MMGKIIFEAQGRDALIRDNRYQVNISQLLTGMYLLYMITDDNRIKIEKLIIE